MYTVDAGQKQRDKVMPCDAASLVCLFLCHRGLMMLSSLFCIEIIDVVLGSNIF